MQCSSYLRLSSALLLSQLIPTPLSRKPSSTTPLPHREQTGPAALVHRGGTNGLLPEAPWATSTVALQVQARSRSWVSSSSGFVEPSVQIYSFQCCPEPQVPPPEANKGDVLYRNHPGTFHGSESPLKSIGSSSVPRVCWQI